MILSSIHKKEQSEQLFREAMKAILKKQLANNNSHKNPTIFRFWIFGQYSGCNGKTVIVQSHFITSYFNNKSASCLIHMQLMQAIIHLTFQETYEKLHAFSFSIFLSCNFEINPWRNNTISIQHILSSINMTIMRVIFQKKCVIFRLNWLARYVSWNR